jgi:1-aminocyclopropane-1-carboxylate deaminase/D-cysteine desulfhydrase-like pyridoxal-dependent ACC family enzyme
MKTNAACITPVQKLPQLSERFGIDLRVKRDDLYPFTGGGNKARKMDYLLQDAENKEANALVTTGSSNSNHARVVALQAAEKGWKSVIVVEGNHEPKNANLTLMELAGADLIFAHKSDVPNAMDRAMAQLKEEGLRPYYIWGGGHMPQAIKGYYKATFELLNQMNGWVPDYVILPSGTGGTQTGLHIGFWAANSSTKVVGISVSRDYEKGKKNLEESVSDCCKYLKKEIPKQDIYFFDEWIGTGYREVYDELIHVIQFVASKEGLIIDPTYTGKAMAGLFGLCDKGWIPKKSKVLFWHTGGLLNLIQDSKYQI